MKYVLCFLVDSFDVRHPHALIEYGGQYFDITLQANPQASRYLKEYIHERTISLEDAIALFAQAGGRIEQIGGITQISGIPPTLFLDGSVRCELITPS